MSVSIDGRFSVFGDDSSFVESSSCLFRVFAGDKDDELTETLFPSRQNSKLSLMFEEWLIIFSISSDDADDEVSNF